MIRTIFGLFLAVVLIVAAVAFFGGYRLSRVSPEPAGAVGTTGTPDRPPATRDDNRVVDPATARDRAARVGEKAAAAINEAGEALDDGRLTAKIKSKMALDDTIEARHINVDTQNNVVTLRGSVRTEAERQRALQLARETRGVTSVVDQLQVR